LPVAAARCVLFSGVQNAAVCRRSIEVSRIFQVEATLRLGFAMLFYAVLGPTGTAFAQQPLAFAGRVSKRRDHNAGWMNPTAQIAGVPPSTKVTAGGIWQCSQVGWK
jgi:hypothetical protein